jgi:hypothetical protein
MDIKDAESMMMQGPIPGNSLTDEPGAFAWEQPPAMNDPEEVLDLYMKGLTTEEVADNVLDMLDIGVPISVVSGTMLDRGIMDGIHTVDMKLIVQPQIALVMKQMAEEAGIDYKETMKDYIDTEGLKQDAKLQRMAVKLKKRVMERAGKMDEGDVLEQQVAEDIVEEQPENEKPQGLMAKE